MCGTCGSYVEGLHIAVLPNRFLRQYSGLSPQAPHGLDCGTDGSLIPKFGTNARAAAASYQQVQARRATSVASKHRNPKTESL